MDFNFSEDKKCFLARGDSENAIAIFDNLNKEGYKVLIITRNISKNLFESYPNSEYLLLKQQDSNKKTLNNIEEMKKRVFSFVKKKEKKAVIIDRPEYLVLTNGFEEFIKSIYSFIDKIPKKDFILILNAMPENFSQKEFSIIKQEFDILPEELGVKKTNLNDDLKELLEFVSEKEKAVFKDIGKYFAITKATTRKRVNILKEKGLVNISKNGRSKIAIITPKGRRLI
jgi:predicted transcriptional regulator